MRLTTFEALHPDPANTDLARARLLLSGDVDLVRLVQTWVEDGGTLAIVPTLEDDGSIGVGALLSRDHAEIAVASASRAAVRTAWPEVQPVDINFDRTIRGLPGFDASIRQERDAILDARSESLGLLFSPKLFGIVGTMRPAVQLALDYAITGAGEAEFSLLDDEDKSPRFDDCTDEECEGCFISAHYHYRHPELQHGFGEFVDIVEDGHPLLDGRLHQTPGHAQGDGPEQADFRFCLSSR